MGTWLDEDEFMLKGRFEGESLEDVADEDPDYLRFLLKEAELESEERTVIEQKLLDRAA